MSLFRELTDFIVTSQFLYCSSRHDFLATFPLYVPYVGGGMRYLKSIYYAAASLLGRYSLHVMPPLACTLRSATQIKIDYTAAMQDSLESACADFPMRHWMICP